MKIFPSPRAVCVLVRTVFLAWQQQGTANLLSEMINQNLYLKET